MRHFAAVALVSLTLVCGCSTPAQDGAGVEPGSPGRTSGPAARGAGAGVNNVLRVSGELLEVLVRRGSLTDQELIAKLSALHTRALVSPRERQLAAYVLAGRLTASGGDVAEALRLYEEAAGCSELQGRARLHAGECAIRLKDMAALEQALGEFVDESLARRGAVIRVHAEKMRNGQGPAHGSGSGSIRQAVDAGGDSAPPRCTPADRVVAQSAYLYATALVLGDATAAGRAEAVLGKIVRFYPDTEYAIGSRYYLGLISLERKRDASACLLHFRSYLRACPSGRFAVEIAKTLMSLSRGEMPEPVLATAATLSSDGPDSKRLSPSEGSNPSGQPVDESIASTGRASVEPLSLSPSDLQLIALGYYKHGVYSEALSLFDCSSPGHILRSVCLIKLARKQEAVAAFLAAISADPGDKLIPNVASTLCKPLSKQDALNLWKHVLAKCPRFRGEALWNVGRRSDDAAAAGVYRALLKSHPTSAHAPESAWWLLWSDVEHGLRAKGAARAACFRRAIDLATAAEKSYPRSEAAARFSFWSGKLLEYMRQETRAMTVYRQTTASYPSSYYGYRARHRLAFLAARRNAKGSVAFVHDRGGAASQSSDQAAPVKSAKPTVKPVDRGWAIRTGREAVEPDWSWPGPPELFRWSELPAEIGRESALLAALGEFDECLADLPFPVDRGTKVWLYLQAGATMKALGTASYHLEGPPRRTDIWELAYPLAYSRIIARESAARGLDPLLVHGLIRQESRYEPGARSRSNAMGLMQLLSGTAYGVAKHNGIALASKAQIFEPETNLRLGIAYLAYVLKRNGGNAMLAVASYNGGPNAVKRWMLKHQRSGISDMDVFVENIPYLETRGYVRKVFANYWNYETLYLSHQSVSSRLLLPARNTLAER